MFNPSIRSVLLTTTLCAVVAVCIGASGCNDADVAASNLSTDADNFKIPRRVVAVNGITDKYLFEVTGYCALKASSDTKGVLNVICKTDAGFKKNSLYMSNNVTLFIEQLSPAQVSTSMYRVVFKPSVILPDIELR